MPAVAHVLVVGAGAAGTAAAILLAEAGVDVEVVEIKPDVAALGFGHHLAGQRTAGARPARRLGRGPRPRLRVRHARPARPRPGRHPHRRDARREDGRPGSAGDRGHVPPRARADPASSGRGVARRAGPLRHHDHRPRSRTTTASTSHFADGETARYDLVIGADGIRSWTRRHARHRRSRPSRWAWASGGCSRPRPASVTRTDLFYGGPQYIAGYCPTGEDTLYAYIVETAQDRSTLTPSSSGSTSCEDCPRPTTDRGTTSGPPHRSGPGQLHLVRDPRPRRPVEPRPGRARSATPHTPARRPSPRARRRPSRTPPSSRELLLTHDSPSRTMWDDVHRPAATSAPRPSSRPRCSSRQWLLDDDRGDVPGLMARVSQLVAEPA